MARFQKWSTPAPPLPNLHPVGLASRPDRKWISAASCGFSTWRTRSRQVAAGVFALHMAEHWRFVAKPSTAYSGAAGPEGGCKARRAPTDRVEFIEDDYRNIRSRFDAFVSVGMLEHVGTENYGALGEVIYRAIGNSGRGLLHFIGMNRPRTKPPGSSRIFRAQSPTLSQVMPPLFEPWNYSVLDVENLRLHYALTLRLRLTALMICRPGGLANVRRTIRHCGDYTWRVRRPDSRRFFTQLFPDSLCRSRMPPDFVDAGTSTKNAASQRGKMDACSILIVGGGPAGAACAWRLQRSER